MLPLDLHVLGLSLAFILSQDQTLRSIFSCLVDVPKIPYPHRDSVATARCFPVRFLQSLKDRSSAGLPLRRHPSVFAGAKVMLFFDLNKYFPHFFVFSRGRLRENPFRNGFQRHGRHFRRPTRTPPVSRGKDCKDTTTDANEQISDRFFLLF